MKKELEELQPNRLFANRDTLEEAFNGEPKSSIDRYDGQDLIDDMGLQGTISSQRLRGFATAVRMMQQ